ncbi:MAG TPA: hypothetical protein VFV34_06195 [Blastocatellia bacterium]|nr:hypothetical protein [Blastocatellia bacterium]
MVILRPTKKLRSHLPTVDMPGQSDGALGDWYVNRLVMARQPLLLLVSSTSLLPIVLPAREVRSLPERLSAVVGARLRRLGVEAELIAAELQSMRPVVTAATVDRSVLGILVDFAKAVPYYFETDTPAGKTLAGLEAWLEQTPCHAGSGGDRVVFPNRKAPDLLRAKWMANRPLQPTSGNDSVV